MTTKKSFNILVLPGDHVGPEIVAEAVKILKTVEETCTSPEIEFNISYDIFGGASIDKHGVAITQEVLEKAKQADAVLFGAVGGPKWGASATSVRPEQGVLDLRKALNCWANIRPCRFPSQSLVSKSVVKENIVSGTDFIVLRENCGGAYFGPKTETEDFASDSWQYSRNEITRIARMAAYLAKTYPKRGNEKKNIPNPSPAKIISCDKANVLASSRLWRKVVQETHDKEFPEIDLVHQLADSAAMVMITKPTSLNGVILCDNTFGDILSDESAVLVGSLGLLPSASLSEIPDNYSTSSVTGKRKIATGIYEPSHGSAPDLSPNTVNPIATILSVGLMLRYTCGLGYIAEKLDDAIEHILDDKSKGGLGLGTRDLGGNLGTKEMGDLIANILKEKLSN